MKFKNVKVGDLVEAKRDIGIRLMFSDNISIKSGDIGLVKNIEDADYAGNLSIKVEFDRETWWLDPKNFRKLREKFTIGDEFVVIKSTHVSLPVGSRHNVYSVSDSGRAVLDDGYYVTANKDGSFELKGINVFLEKVTAPTKREEVELTGSDLTRKMLADGQEGVLCYVDDYNEEGAVKEGLARTVIGFENGWFRTTGVASWRHAVPVEKVEPFSRWTHSNGNVYTVTDIANKDSNNQEKYPITVVYKGEDGKVWSLPLIDWHRRMTKN